MILGIDLGTTNTLASYIDGNTVKFIDFDGDKLLPSVLAISNGTFIVGKEAESIWLKNSKNAVRSVKSFIGKLDYIEMLDLGSKEVKKFRTEEVYAQILNRVKQSAEKQLTETITDVVISVPAFFDDLARQKTIQAANYVGFNVLRLINEPTAAALGYGYGQSHYSHRVIVYDLGGGTFDVSILEINGGLVEIIASDGDRQLGGDDIDLLLLREMRIFDKDFNLSDAKALKEMLSEELKYNYKGFGIDRTKFNTLIAELVYKTIDITKRTIYRAGYSEDDFDKVLLVGGSTRIPYIKYMLEENLGISVSSEIDPDLAVVRGTAIQAGKLEGKELDSTLIDVAPHSISVACVVEKNGKLVPNYCAKLIQKNTPIPCTVEEKFSTLYDGQDNVKISIYQGESDYEEDNLLLKEFKFDLDSKNDVITLRFSYDLDGKVDVQVLEQDNSAVLKELSFELGKLD